LEVICSGKSFKYCPDQKLITSPKTFDSQTIAGIFPGKVIIVDNGKLYVINTVFSIDCGGLGTPFLSHHFLAVKRFLTWPSFPG